MGKFYRDAYARMFAEFRQRLLIAVPGHAFSSHSKSTLKIRIVAININYLNNLALFELKTFLFCSAANRHISHVWRLATVLSFAFELTSLATMVMPSNVIRQVQHGSAWFQCHSSSVIWLTPKAFWKKKEEANEVKKEIIFLGRVEKICFDEGAELW